MFDVGLAAFPIIVITILLIIGPERLSPIVSTLLKIIRSECSDDPIDQPSDQKEDSK
jgi:Sec-independent protein translocase protein TatA